MPATGSRPPSAHDLTLGLIAVLAGLLLWLLTELQTTPAPCPPPAAPLSIDP